MDNIILIGMPAVGKSTVGVIVCKAPGFIIFVDTDLGHPGKGRKAS